MSNIKVNRPQDAIVSEMIKQLPMENFTLSRSVFRNASWARWNLQVLGRGFKLVFLREPDAEPKKGIRSYWSIALTSVMSKWYASCIILRLEKERKPEN